MRRVGPLERRYVQVRRALDVWAEAMPTLSIFVRQIAFASLFVFVLGMLSAVFAVAAHDTLQLAVDAIGQVVPAIVIAVFVFGVGTAFVVAQVVPPARGTRAVDLLQGRRFALTITPALALVTGSAVLLGMPVGVAHLRQALALALLVGSVVYVVWATAALLSIYRDATEPRKFRDLVVRKQLPPWPARWGESIQQAILLLEGRSDRSRRSIEVADREADEEGQGAQGSDGQGSTPESSAPPWHGPETIPRLQAQLAAERLYRLIRTARGWARVAANTGDSRELHESLECVIALVTGFSEAPFGIKRSDPSRVYPMSWPRSYDVDRVNPRDPLWRFVAKPCGQSHDCVATRAAYLAWEDRHRQDTWFPNEVGRALVRAAEYGLRTGSLLDRDLLRLLNTIVLCLERFSVGMDASNERVRASGVMLRYLAEVGMAVRWSSREQLEWFYSPAIHLARLSSTPRHPDLAMGATAGLVLVVDSILWREDQDAPSAGQRHQVGQAGALEIEQRAAHMGATLAAHGVPLRIEHDDREPVVCLAASGILRPEERPIVSEPEVERLTAVLTGLTAGH